MKRLILTKALIATSLLHFGAALAQGIPLNLIHQYDASRLESDGQTCMSWYSQFLADPWDARYRVVEVDGTVFSIDIHASNGYGGRSVMRASCEIKNGRLDQGWTKIHAKRGGWIAN